QAGIGGIADRLAGVTGAAPPLSFKTCRWPVTARNLRDTVGNTPSSLAALTFLFPAPSGLLR
ncbi:hypothetical protein, partial [Paraburkholderia kirstenboschensis]|uniref:hypothetical protein n=1 Tax=Paraburkholderia kirstenboschensis TaxID=1245436 RepID=UPI000A5CC349